MFRKIATVTTMAVAGLALAACTSAAEAPAPKTEAPVATSAPVVLPEPALPETPVAAEAPAEMTTPESVAPASTEAPSPDPRAEAENEAPKAEPVTHSGPDRCDPIDEWWCNEDGYGDSTMDDNVGTHPDGRIYDGTPGDGIDHKAEAARSARDSQGMATNETDNGFIARQYQESGVLITEDALNKGEGISEIPEDKARDGDIVEDSQGRGLWTDKASRTMTEVTDGQVTDRQAGDDAQSYSVDY